jgi:hypothetical protein
MGCRGLLNAVVCAPRRARVSGVEIGLDAEGALGTSSVSEGGRCG